MKSSRAAPQDTCIQIRGARTHNPEKRRSGCASRQTDVITGVSGSGKSSLAFDTLFAEGQRQYLESFRATHAVLGPTRTSGCRYCAGLQPTLCIDQQQGVLSPRSTVGTVSEIYDYLRLLMARIAIPACHLCGQPIDRQPGKSNRRCTREPSNRPIDDSFPHGDWAKRIACRCLDRIAKAGLLRVRIDGEDYEIESPPTLPCAKNTASRLLSIASLSVRIVENESSWPFNLALRLSNGLVESLSRSSQCGCDG